jgi:hypothetical protein
VRELVADLVAEGAEVAIAVKNRGRRAANDELQVNIFPQNAGH